MKDAVDVFCVRAELGQKE